MVMPVCACLLVFHHHHHHHHCYRHRDYRKQESRAVARKSRYAAAVLFGLKFAYSIHYSLMVAKLGKPGFRASNILAQNRI